MSTNRAKVGQEFVRDAAAREWIGGFLVLGLLLGLLGSLSIAWHYHIDTDPARVAIHFLVLDACCLAGMTAGQPLLERLSIRVTALIACAIGFASVLALTALVPPAPMFWRVLDLGFTGFAAGMLLCSLLYVLEQYYLKAAVRAVNLCALLFGCGALVATLLVAATYFAGSVHVETPLIALLPLLFFFIYAQNRYPGARKRIGHVDSRISESVAGVRAIAAVLLALLLFFQFGSEWALAGWLPLFLIRRLGSNPEWAILALGSFFLIVVLGRLLAFRFLPKFDDRKLLIASTAVAMAGYLLLSFTNSIAVAYAAIAVIGAAFAPVYPLMAANLDERFSYQPRFYKRMFSVAIAGAMTMQCALGFIASYAGIEYIMLLPALGSIAVLVLTLLIILEAHLMTDRRRDKPKPMMPAEKE